MKELDGKGGVAIIQKPNNRGGESADKKRLLDNAVYFISKITPAPVGER